MFELIGFVAACLGVIAFSRTKSLRKELKEIKESLGTEIKLLSKLVGELSERLETIETRLSAPPAPARKSKKIGAKATPPAMAAAALISAPDTKITESLPNEANFPPPVLATIVEEISPGLEPNENAPVPPLVAAPALPAAPKRSLEEIIGAQWSVWAGALALGLGGILLVRYSIHAGYLGPGVRIALGLVFAAILAGAGEYLRRHDYLSKSDLVSQKFDGAYIPGALTAAASVAAFASVYSAHALYNFIGPATALFALGLVGLATLLAGIIHGPALTAMGLLGALGAPMLVSSRDPSPFALVTYLTIVCGVAYTLAHRRLWLWLLTATGIGAAAWLLLMYPISFDAAATHAILQISMLGLVFFSGHLTKIDSKTGFDLLASITMVIASTLGLLVFFRFSDEHPISSNWMIGIALITLIMLIVGLSRTRLIPLTAISGIFAIAFMVIWPPFHLERSGRTATAPFADWFGRPDFSGWYLAFVGLAALTILILCAAHVLKPAAQNFWVNLVGSTVAVVTSVSALIIMYLRFDYPEQSWRFAALAAGLAIAFTFAARKARQLGAQANLQQGIFASAALAALTLVSAFALNGGFLIAALALTGFGSAIVAQKLAITMLRWGVVAIGLLICARLAYDPRIVGAELSTRPIFNWLLIGYGVPAAAFFYAARVLRQSDDDTPPRVADALAILFTALLLFFEMHHYMNGGDAFSTQSSLVEQGLMTMLSFGFSLVLTRLDAGRANIIFRYASLALAPIGIAQAVIQLGLNYNPLFDNTNVAGGVLLNGLLAGYLFPGIMAAILYHYAVQIRPQWYITAVAVTSGLLVLAYGLLEIRLMFVGQNVWFENQFSLTETGVEASFLTLTALVLAWASVQQQKHAWLVASVAVFTLAILSIIFGQGMLTNPIFTNSPVTGHSPFDALTVAYLLPALLCFALARTLIAFDNPKAQKLRLAATIATITLIFVWLTMETRLAFQSDRLGTPSITQNEWYTYSAVWLAFGLMLLLYGVWRAYPAVRYASGVFVLAGTLKVFLLDLAGLDGALRALSFIGLGVALIIIGLVYQKFVFTNRRAANAV